MDLSATPVMSICQKHPGRFVGTIQLPMQAPDLAVKELERAAKLPGMKAVYMAMHVGGRNIDAYFEVLTNPS